MTISQTAVTADDLTIEYSFAAGMKFVTATTRSWRELTEILAKAPAKDHDKGAYGSVVPGIFHGLRRLANNVTKAGVIGLDVDGTATWNDAATGLDLLGIAGVMYTSHNHRVSKTDVLVNVLDQYRAINKCETIVDAAVGYLRDGRAYHPSFIEGVTVNEKTIDKKDEKGNVKTYYVVNHKPLDKYRVIVPLKSPFTVSDYTSSLAAEKAYDDLCRRLSTAIGIRSDDSCRRLNQLFYYGTRKNMKSMVFRGTPVDPATLPKATVYTGLWVCAGASSSAGGVARPKLPGSLLVTDSAGVGGDLVKWLKRDGAVFELVRALQEKGEPIEDPRGMVDGHWHLQCPREEYHGSTAGGFFLAQGEVDGSLWRMHCGHNGCVGVHQIEHLAAMVKNGWITWEVLNDWTYQPLDARNEFEELPVPDDYVSPEDKAKKKEQSNTVSDGPITTIVYTDAVFQPVVDQIESYLNKHENMYNFCGRVSSAVKVSVKRGDGQTVEKWVMRNVRRAEALDMITQRFAFVKPPSKPGLPPPILPPQPVIEVVLSRPAEHYRPLDGLASVPYMRPDGTLNTAGGYDSMLGLLSEADPEVLDAVRKIPDRPTREDALASLGVLEALVSEFAFSSAGGQDDDEIGAATSRSVALAALLTAVQRPALPSAPLFAFSAAQPGSGKSYLADVMAVIATGQVAAPFSQSDNDTEFTKRIDAALLSGCPVTVIDNVKRLIDSDNLDLSLTSPITKVRGFGTQKEIPASTRTLWMATGNQIALSTDLVRRSLLCYLNPRMDAPETRRFKGNPVAEVLADRGRYVTAALTVIQAYHVAGYPGARGLGSFDQWSRQIRSALIWLGRVDPCRSTDELRTANPFRREMAELFSVWSECIGIDNPVTARELAECEPDVTEDKDVKFVKMCSHLRDLTELRTSCGLSPRHIGNFLRKRRGVVVNGMTLNSRENRDKVAEWTLRRVEGNGA